MSCQQLLSICLIGIWWNLQDLFILSHILHWYNEIISRCRYISIQKRVDVAYRHESAVGFLPLRSMAPGNPEEGELRPQLLDRFGMHALIRTGVSRFFCLLLNGFISVFWGLFWEDIFVMFNDSKWVEDVVLCICFIFWRPTISFSFFFWSGYINSHYWSFFFNVFFFVHTRFLCCVHSRVNTTRRHLPLFRDLSLRRLETADVRYPFWYDETFESNTVQLVYTNDNHFSFSSAMVRSITSWSSDQPPGHPPKEDRTRPGTACEDRGEHPGLCGWPRGAPALRQVSSFWGFQRLRDVSQGIDISIQMVYK